MSVKYICPRCKSTENEQIEFSYSKSRTTRLRKCKKCGYIASDELYNVKRDVKREGANSWG